MKHPYRLLCLFICLTAFLNCRNAGADARAAPSAQQQEAGKTSDTLSRSLFPDGKLQQLVLKKDSGEYKQLIYTFYRNGQIEDMGHQGYYSGKETATGMYTGTWYHYDSLGKLQETTLYHNDEQPKAYIEKTKYYTNGKVRAIERYNNYELYESDIDSIGSWKYFNEQGKLVKTVTHKP